MVVDQNSLSGNSHSSRINMLLSRNFRELHVYLSRNLMLGNHDIQLSRNFRGKKKFLSRTRKNTFARVSNITCTAFAIKTPYKDLWIDHHIYYITHGLNWGYVPKM